MSAQVLGLPIEQTNSRKTYSAFTMGDKVYSQYDTVFVHGDDQNKARKVTTAARYRSYWIGKF